jgi:nucleotide-binding universal stress UspA family protein
LARTRLDAASAWLSRQGVQTQVSVETTEIDVGNALLSRCSDLGVDLLVAGAWSHSRLGERLFGGVTRTLLDSMTVPVLMAH